MMKITLLNLLIILYFGVASSSFHSNKYVNILKSKTKNVIAGALTAYCLFPSNLPISPCILLLLLINHRYN